MGVVIEIRDGVVVVRTLGLGNNDVPGAVDDINDDDDGIDSRCTCETCAEIVGLNETPTRREGRR